MKNKNDSLGYTDSGASPEQLRRRAEAVIGEKAAVYSEDIAALSPRQIKQTLHELKVHQIELEMQNEELRRAQADLDAARERYFDLYDLAPVGYCTIGENGLILEANLTAAKMLGTARGTLVKQPISRFIFQKDQDIYYHHRKQCFETDEPQVCELRMVKSGSATIWTRLEAAVAQGADGEPVCRVVMSDITAQRKAENDKKRLEDQLRQAQKMESIGTLAGGIAHEFNNILSIIIGNNELVRSDLPDWGHARENTEEIRIAGLRAREVVKQLLTFSRQDDIKKKPIDIGPVVKGSMKLIRSSIPANIDIKQSISDDVCPIIGNPTQISQLLINLFTNATDAMLHTGSMITLELGNVTLDEIDAGFHPQLKPGRCVKLKITDDGCGMGKKTLDRMFEPYFTTKDIGKGTGIGLAIVHGIVERHNGAISVESQPDKGTVFSILFPAYEGLIDKVPPQRTVLPTGNERILFVDDEEPILNLSKAILESLGYIVKGSTDSLLALDMFKADPDEFDLVITDMAMPKMTGDRLASEILKIRPDIPTVMCTGYSDNISEKEAVEIGIRAFIMKPLDRTDFAVIVRKALDEAKEKTE